MLPHALEAYNERRWPQHPPWCPLAIFVRDETQIVAGLARTFTPEALVGRRVVVVANLAPRDFGKGLVSHGMLLATGAEDALELATVPGDAKAGMRLK